MLTKIRQLKNKIKKAQDSICIGITQIAAVGSVHLFVLLKLQALVYIHISFYVKQPESSCVYIDVMASLSEPNTIELKCSLSMHCYLLYIIPY